VKDWSPPRYVRLHNRTDEHGTPLMGLESRRGSERILALGRAELLRELIARRDG
jgi:hypothetical protein